MTISTDDEATRSAGAWHRLLAGAGWGLTATVAMSAVMLAATAADVAPMPEPIPAALVASTFGELPVPLLIAVAGAAHLGYGAAAGAVLAGLVRQVRFWIGLGYGAVLWALMGLVWLPYLGWGLFGTAVTPKIAVGTLALHLIYGGTLGMQLDRRPPAAGAAGSAS